MYSFLSKKVKLLSKSISIYLQKMLHNISMRNGFGRGFLILTFCGMICKVIGAFFRLPLTYILGTEGLGVFQLIMSVYSFALILTSGGITVSLSKLISSARARGRYGKIRWYIYLSLVTCVVVSFLFGLIFFFLSRQIALLQKTEAASLTYRFFFPLLLFTGLVSLFRGVYQGYENMTPTGVSQIIEQLCKFVFGLIFAYVLSKISLAYGVLGAFLGILSGEVLAFVYLLIAKKSIKLNKYKIHRGSRREYFSYLIPATFGLTISPFVHFLDSIIAINRIVVAGMTASMATSLYGLQTGVVGSILNFPVIISVSLSTSLLPYLSFEHETDKNEVELKKSFALLWYSVLPVTLGLLAISLPLYQVVYPFFDRIMFIYAVRLTIVGAVSTILLSLMQYLTSVLQAKGEFKYVTLSLIVGGIGKLFCTIFLCSIPEINILGLAIGNVVFGLIVVIFSLIKLKGTRFATLDNFFVPLLSAMVMLVVTSYIAAVLTVPPVWKLIISVLIGASLYILLTLPLIKGFKNEYVGKKQNRGKDEQKRIIVSVVKKNKTSKE